jgi:hypothetical protein
MTAASPVRVLDGGRPVAAVGAAGGRKVIIATAQVAAQVVGGVPAQEAIERLAHPCRVGRGAHRRALA